MQLSRIKTASASYVFKKNKERSGFGDLNRISKHISRPAGGGTAGVIQ
jgi:hypothetical protein